MYDPALTERVSQMTDEEKAAYGRTRDEAAAEAQGEQTAWTRLFDLMRYEDNARAELTEVEKVIRDLAALDTTYSPLSEGMSMTSTWTMSRLGGLSATARAIIARWDARTPA